MKNFTLSILLLLCFGTFAQHHPYSAKTIAPDAKSGNGLGVQVSLDGRTLLVSSVGDDYDSIGMNYVQSAGSAYFMQLDSVGNLLNSQKIVPSERGSSDFFGRQLVLEGSEAFISSPDALVKSSPVSSFARGKVFYFTKDNANYWQEAQRIIAPDSSQHSFGDAIAFEDSALAVSSISEPAVGSPPTQFAGAVYIFRKNASQQWVAYDKIFASDPQVFNKFGHALALSGNSLAVGDYRNGTDSIGQNPNFSTGAVYLFKADSIGNWIEVKKITAPDRSHNDQFGFSLSMDEDVLAIGSPYNHAGNLGSPPIDDCGAVYVYEKNALGNWNFVQKLAAHDRDDYQEYGYDVEVRDDTLLVGSTKHNSNHSGSPFEKEGAMFMYVKDSVGVWKHYSELNVPSSTGAEKMGTSVSFYNGLVVGGSPEQSDSNMNGNGAAFVFYHCPIDTIDLDTTVCKSLLSPSGKHVWKSSGTYLDTLQNIKGCDSILRIALSIVDTTVILDSLTGSFIAQQDTALYQWVDCDNNYLPIAGENGKSFTPTSNGRYAVIIYAGCADTSGCHAINNVSIKEDQLLSQIELFPNPADERVQINLPMQMGITQLEVYNSLGALIDIKLIADQGSIQTENYEAGVYYFQFKWNGFKRTFKIHVTH
jgi:hypothetical protein